ncbi:hypothetical protein SULI_07825 [Saccharolobus solfataricus]|jgi:hypothetical protein|uniref:Uncharacterized protein n=2 Tax=Saccharolobus solfataricus TaxID=2287 RepID=A0A0E3GTH4_SACSO|nr:hypothetical protein [Saccharolobus solfataricus]AKA73826.1 hypothetical protein SULB_1565 [Saccharolobus solfataricus]AKA76523.1 hypothetical protein SULC_1563 [Saccharolobus solfataricus]AKA79216.1 hypothetical protein SULA_1564 [Saccharolobus solfataricus]AZF68306.1 hypothetical protein SULG_07825 [Saccharolobus solfataricus]AZF70926.1 hypothetical protein SULH_07825 [Saccharolobus solfataricus]
MEGWDLKLLIKKAEQKGFKVEKLPSGALIFSKRKAEIQFFTILDTYYVKYINNGRAYIIYKLDEKVIDAIFEGRLDELTKSDDVVRIPSD